MNKDLWFQIAKIIAESDSIGEGYNYCSEYTKSRFISEVKEVEEAKGAEYGVYNYASVAEAILDLLKNVNT